MNTTSNYPAPSEIKNLTEFYIVFRFNKWFISDNKTLFLLPKDSFCNQCFMRRYFAEHDCQKVTQISGRILQLAKIIDDTNQESSSWRCYSIETGEKVKDFDLVSFESCQNCMPKVICSRDHARKRYESLLNNSTTVNIGEIRHLLFSFGFAHSISTKNRDDLGNQYFQKIIGKNFFTHINARYLSPTGQPAELTTLGYSQERELAETKAIMEYLERYAFIENTHPLKTKTVDEKLVRKFLTLFSRDITAEEMSAIKRDAIWGVNLGNREVCPVPLRFIYDKGDLNSIKPTSSGFAAHYDFSGSMKASMIELVERDAFVRSWHDPGRAYEFSPEEGIASELNDVLSVLQVLLNNENMVTACFLVRSPTELPVVMLTISSSDISSPPSLIFGYGAGLSLRQAALSSLEELKTNALNVLTSMSNDKNFLSRQFDYDIKSLPDRMNLYATHQPREKLKFLDMENPLTDGIYKDLEKQSLDGVAERFSEHGIGIYGIDATPECFADKHVFVTRAFSPDLYPLQFECENDFNLAVGNLSVKGELPHFFI